jgi:predicted nucleotidyltransferase
MNNRELSLDSVTNAVLARFAEELRRRFGEAVIEVRLYRSMPRFEVGYGADVDVAVVLEHVGWNTRREVIDLATDMGLLPFDLLISPTIFDRETYERWREQERPLVMDIEREGLPL